MASAVWLERHTALKEQAEQLIARARAEVDAGKAGQLSDGRRSAQSLAARRKLMQVSKVLAEMEQLSQDNLCASTHNLDPCCIAHASAHSGMQLRASLDTQ
jgi:hypothetical protein